MQKCSKVEEANEREASRQPFNDHPPTQRKKINLTWQEEKKGQAKGENEGDLFISGETVGRDGEDEERREEAEGIGGSEGRRGNPKVQMDHRAHNNGILLGPLW